MSKVDKKYNFLKPIKNGNLTRIGRDEDGGYIVDSNILKKSNNLLSFGLGSDWSFEIDYLRQNNRGKVHVYDHTVNILVYLGPLLKCFKRFITFRKSFKDLIARYNDFVKYLKFINNKNILFVKKKAVTKITQEKKEIDIKKALEQIGFSNNVIFKIDIEGDEYSLIDEIEKHSKLIDTLIIEFHEIDQNENIFVYGLKKLLDNFDIIHIHGNNHCKDMILGLPTVVEITFNNKKFRPKEIEYKNEFPLQDLDFPNNPYEKDLKFSFQD